MLMKCFKKCLWTSSVLVACLYLAPTDIRAAVAWNEGVNGDISGNRLSPSSAALLLGSNTVTATSVGTGAASDREYITLSVPPTRLLGAVYVQSYAGLDEIAFIGVQSGTTFTEPTGGTNVANVLGYTHFGPAVQPVGSNILPAISTGPGAMGFSPALLPAGNYTFWIQQTGASPATYTLDFLVVPEPGALVLCGTGLAMLLSANRRQRAKR
jgi:hypothetical protein